MKKELIEYLTSEIARKTRQCNKWLDSGDSGACYEHEVKPLIKMLEWVKELNEK